MTCGNFLTLQYPRFPLPQARDEGADLVEFDIGLTRDAVAVLMHDDSLDRTTNMRGALRAQTLEELRAAGCDCAANFK